MSQQDTVLCSASGKDRASCRERREQPSSRLRIWVRGCVLKARRAVCVLIRTLTCELLVFILSKIYSQVQQSSKTSVPDRPFRRVLAARPWCWRLVFPARLSSHLRELGCQPGERGTAPLRRPARPISPNRQSVVFLSFLLLGHPHHVVCPVVRVSTCPRLHEWAAAKFIERGCFKGQPRLVEPGTKKDC